ncbi:MAG TPA: uroporphyrinogen-III C-methyltransferase [Actinomycetes bacterium]|nr:uroporphyrinogen-III C-methyltransferase [Actinomycetes bacterium]
MSEIDHGSPQYPLLLDLTDRRVIVVGGGPVAARRARMLLDAAADVHVVAPFVCEDLWDAASAGALTVHVREFETADLDGAWLVHTATGERPIDDLVAAEADRRHLWCVRADDAATSRAWTPAVARIGDVVVAVNAGGDPRRAVELRNDIAQSLSAGEFSLRRRRVNADGMGHVALVGGGPGDPGLITTRGRQLLAEADVVIVDRLAPRSLLDELDPDVEVIDAGKAPHAHTLTQDQINALLVEHATAGRWVVRLKGGDPYVLGRGSEEAAACREAGVPVEVVPGVTSALAVPAAAGIPVTARGVTSRFTVVSGHDGPLDFASLAALEGTLLFLMGVSRLPEIARELIRHGRNGDEPVAVIERGTTPLQRVTVATLGTIADACATRGVQSPAVIVVGDVAAFAGDASPGV